MIVRQTSANDAGELAQIHKSCFEEAWAEDFFRRMLADPGVIALAAGRAAETDLQAFVLIRTAAQESEVLTIATLPAVRRCGLARALLIAGAAEAARRQVTAMFLEVAEDNAAAVTLYRGLGFVLNGRRRLYYRRAKGEGIDALMLRAAVPFGHGNDGQCGLDCELEPGD